MLFCQDRLFAVNGEQTRDIERGRQKILYTRDIQRDKQADKKHKQRRKTKKKNTDTNRQKRGMKV